MMKTKNKSCKKPLACLAVLALATGVFGVCSLSSANSKIAVNAAPSTAIEFTDADALATNSELVTNVDTDNNGVVDAASAWKIDLTQSYGAITFNTPIDLAGAKGIQLRAYIHWSPDALAFDDVLCVHKDAITDQAWAGSVWAFWRGADSNQPDRPLVQDEWMTFTITDGVADMTSLSKLSIVPAAAAGKTIHEDAYMLVDSITVIKDGDTVNGANVVTEFGADQVSHDGQGWRSDLVVAGDGCSQGATTAWKAKAQPGIVSVSFPAVDLSALYGTNLKGLQIRMYAHLGEITGDTNIEVQLNGTTMGHWASEASGLFDTTRPIVQDQWITYTIAENFSLASLSKLGFNFPGSGISYYDDAYILVDKITTIENSDALGENVVTEFAADQISQSGKGWRTDLLVDADTDGDGVVDAENAWRINLDTGVASTGITFANPIDLSAYAGIQFRVYVHWGTNFGEGSKISFCANTAKPGNEGDGVFAHWYGNDQADRPMKQDEWITFTVAENLPTTSLSALGIYITPNGVSAYDDAYMLIDKVVGIPKTAETLPEDYVTEFAANEISHSGQGWRTDLVTDMDENNQGSDSAFRMDIKNYTKTYFKLAEPYSLDGVEAIQMRVYLHYGQFGSTLPAISLYANDEKLNGNNNQTFVYWSGDGQHQWFRQDEWVTLTISNELSKFNGSLSSIGIGVSLGNGVVADDAYLLIDNLTVVRNYDRASNVLTEFAHADIDNTGKGWRVDMESNVDKDGDGVIEAKDAYRLNFSPAAGLNPELTFANPISLNGVKTFHLRMYIHWGTISGNGAGMLIKAKNGATVTPFLYMWSDDKLKQDQWLDFYLDANEVAKMGDQITGIVIEKMNETSVTRNNEEAYILFDKMYEIRHTVTFNKGDLGTETVICSEGQTVSAPDVDKEGYEVAWYTDEACTQSYDFNTVVTGDMTLYAKYTVVEISDALLEFTSKEATAVNSTLVTDVDTDGDGVVDAISAWKVNLNAGISSAGVNLANAIDLSAYAGIQFRVYVHWGTNFGPESTISFCQNIANPGSLYHNVFALWKGSDQADRPMKQDEWITFTVAENLPTTSLSALGIYIQPNGLTAYDDAYILIDKMVGVPKTAETLPEDYVTEFAANEISHSGQGWRTDLVTDMDENNQGSDSAFRMDIKNYTKTYFKLAEPYSLDGVEAIQMRVYLHYGQFGSILPAISLYANDSSLTATDENKTFVYWSGDGQHQWFRQDEWVTLTISNELSKFNGSLSSIGIKVTTGNGTVADDAYILIDNLTVARNYDRADNVLTEFAPADIDNNGKGWRVDMEANIDKDGDGVVEAKDAYRLNFSPASGLNPELTFATPISLDGVKTFHLRMYIHWGTMSNGGAGMLIKAKNGDTVTPFLYMWSDDKLKQDQWLDFYLDANEVANLGGQITGIVVEKMGETNVTGNNEAYVLFDKMYEIRHTVTFNKGDLGTETVICSEGETVSAPVVDKEGYSVAWYTDEACTQSYDFNAIVTDDMTLYAKYTINTYTVTFNHPDGYTDKSVTVNWNTSVSEDCEEAACQETGKYVAWYTDEACTQAFDFSTKITANTVIYGKYTFNLYSVTFAHGANFGGDVVQKVEHGSMASAPASTNEAYNVAWYQNAECTVAFDFNAPITGNVTVYAKYTIKTFTVTFNHGSGITGDVVENVEYGSKVTAKEGKKTGYTVAWYQDAACTQAFDFANTEIKANTVVYAKYSPIPYTVTFMDGENRVKDVTVNYDAKVAMEESNREGYTVIWYTDAACTNAYDFNTAITGDLTLYGGYTIKTFNVTFNHGDDEVVTVIVNYGETVAEAASKKEGYSVKWYVDEAHTERFDFDAPVKADYQLYPVYKINEYTVTFNFDEPATTVKVEYGQTVTAPAAADREGYTVVWYVDEACTQAYDFDTPVSGNLTLYPQYTAISYTVTVNIEGVETTVTVNYGEKMTEPEADKEGYTVAWYTDKACTEIFDFDTVITEDLTIYAKYTKIDNGDSSSSDSSNSNSSGNSNSSDDNSSQSANGGLNNLFSGCSGIVGTGAALSVSVLAAAAGAILLRKKKDDDEE